MTHSMKHSTSQTPVALYLSAAEARGALRTLVGLGLPRSALRVARTMPIGGRGVYRLLVDEADADTAFLLLLQSADLVPPAPQQRLPARDGGRGHQAAAAPVAQGRSSTLLDQRLALTTLLVLLATIAALVCAAAM